LILSNNKVSCLSKPKEQQKVGNILLAGATGYLGMHILSDFLENNDGNAYCLVRGDSLSGSENRMLQLLNYYFADQYDSLLGTRIQVVCADLEKDLFGLNQEHYNMLTRNVTTVINSAASVKHYGSYKYFYNMNVETVNRLIAFCFESGTKLIHISTLSVSGNSFADEFDGFVSKTEKHFFESDLYIGQPLDNVYARSKFEAEKKCMMLWLKG